MVEFVSLFLGLVLGPTRVEIAVDPAVAAVVLELDGEAVGTLTAAPWELEIDLGDELAPRRLVARALDASGVELDRATRFLNVYRPPAATGYVLHRNPNGWVTMMSLSGERRGQAPRRSAVTLDGREVEFEDPARIWLPPLDPSELHVIETVVEYADGLVARDRIGVGGPALGEASSRLTAVPARVPDPRARIEPAATTARLAASGERLRVLGVERGEAEIVFVRDAAAGRAVERIGPARGSMGALGGGRDARAARIIHSVPRLDGEWLRILDSTASAQPAGLELDRTPAPLLSEEGGFGLFWHLKNVDPEAAASRGAWIADSVAVAGARAAFGGRRRAVVLVLAPESTDAGSRLDPRAVRRYLERLGVPLHVWYVGKAASAPEAWGAPIAVRSVAGIQQALDAVRAELERQRIAWVDGVYLPGEVEIELASRPASTAADPGRARR